MKNKFKKVLRLFVALAGFAFIAFPATAVFATDEDGVKIEDIHFEVKLLTDGAAEITEVRQMDISEMTELFIRMDNLQDSKVEDFYVEGFTEEKDWDSERSREEKAGKYGIIDDGEVYELVWGIGEYGKREYRVHYTLTNMVRQLEDGQSLYWDFNTFSDLPTANVSMTFTAPFSLRERNVTFKGFGTPGEMRLENGRLLVEPSGDFKDGNHLTVLLQFLNSPFKQLATEVDQTLNSQKEMATADSSYNEDDDSSAVKWIVGILGLGAAVSISGLGLYSYRLNKWREKQNQLPMGFDMSKINKDQQNSRIPYYGEDIADIAYLVQKYAKGNFFDYFYAYLIKWSNAGHIQIETTKKDGIFGDKYDAVLLINDFEHQQKINIFPFEDYIAGLSGFDNRTYEQAVWLMLLGAADETGRITAEAFEEWISRHLTDLSELDNLLEEYSKNRLEKMGYFSLKTERFWGRSYEIQEATPKGMELVTRLDQFYHYVRAIDLKDETDLHLADRDSLFVWAAIFEEVDEFAEQMAKFHPDVWEEWTQEADTFYAGYWGYHHLHHVFHSGLSHHSDYSGSSATSMSFGGGAGAGGGGGGGAR